MGEKQAGHAELPCAKCGSDIDCTIRYVACAAETTYAPPESHGAGLVDLLNKTISHRMKDDLQVWSISLCGRCRAEGYEGYLTKQMRLAVPWVLVGVGSLAVSLLLILLSPGNWEGGMPLGWVIFGFALFSGVIIGAGQSLRYVSCSRRLKTFKVERAVPPERLEDAYKGESERILSEIQTTVEGGWEAWHRGVTRGGFRLPSFRDLDDYTEEDRKKLKGLKEELSGHERSIIAVGESRDSLVASLPEEWRKFVVTNHKAHDAP